MNTPSLLGPSVSDADTANKERRNQLAFGGSAGGTDANGNLQPNSVQQAADNYAQKGNNYDQRGAYQLNYGQANRSFAAAGHDRLNARDDRTAQQDALALQQQAAQGNAPSQAELLGRGLINQGMESQLAGAASAKGGPLAQMAAQRQAQQGAAAYQQQGANSLAAMRAGEMNDARNAFGQQAGAMRGQDYQGAEQAASMAGQQAQMAQAQGGLEMQQRQMNQQGQEYYDQLGYNVQNDQANRNLQEYKLGQDQWAKQADLDQQSKKDSQGLVGSIMGGLADGAGSVIGALSDERTKVPLSIGGDSSGAVDIGGSGGISGSQILAASTGHTGNAMAPVGGGGLVGGTAPASTMGPTGDTNSAAAGQGLHSFGRRLMSLSDERTKTKADDIIGGYKASLAQGPAVRSEREPEYQFKDLRGDPKAEQMLDDRYNEERQRAGARPEWLDSYMAGQQAPQALAYGSPTEKGVAGAPKGYAAARAGKPGAMWGDTAKEDEDRGVAPGTTDFERSEPKSEKEKPLLLSMLGRGMKGFGHSMTMSYSDDRAKQEAYQAGSDAAFKQLTGNERYRTRSDSELTPEKEYVAPDGPHSLGMPKPSPMKRPEGVELEYGPAKVEPQWRVETGEAQIEQPPRAMKSFTRENPLTELQKDANRRGEGFAYAYKDGFRPPEQAPGEMNFGPSAQKLEKNPLTATAVKTDARTGMRMLDTHKLLKSNTSSIASLQKQIDQLEYGRARTSRR